MKNIENHVYEPIGKIFYCRIKWEGMMLKNIPNFCPFCGQECEGNIHLDRALLIKNEITKRN